MMRKISTRREFALLVPEDEEFSVYSGYVHLDRFSFPLRIEMSSPPLLAGANITTGKELESFLGVNGMQLLSSRFKNAKTLENFLLELKDLLERALRERKAKAKFQTSKHLSSSLFCSQLVHHLEGHWNKVVWIDESLRGLKMEFEDREGRKHTLQLDIPPDYPLSPPHCSACFPEPVELLWDPSSPSSSSLSFLLHQYIAASEKYQPLWRQLDDIDAHCWVIEPEAPSYSSTMRRLSLGHICSLHFDLEPSHPHRMPECRFMGSDHIIAPLKAKLHSNFRLWDNQKLLRENLQTVLEMELPGKQGGREEEEESFDCSICYSYRLGDQIPDRVCDNAKCKRAYHTPCLYEWLRSASTRQSFDTMFGNCPYCSEPITVKVL